MATLIDSLLIKLGLDTQGVQQGAAQTAAALKATRGAAAQTGSELEIRGKQAAMFYTRLRNEALSFFAVLTIGSGLKNFIGDTVSGAASLGRLSANLGMSTRDLSAWQKASERAGGSADGITRGLQGAQRAVAQFKAGLGSEETNWFFRYGGNADDLKDAETFLKAQADILQRLYTQSPDRAALAAGQMGIGDNFDLLKRGRAGVDALVDAQRRNSAITEKDAADADRLRVRMLDLRDTLQAVATRVLVAMLPALERLLEYLNRLAEWAQAHEKDITRWVDEGVRALGEFLREVDKGVDAVGGWKTVLIALLALNLAGPVAGLVALAAALVSVGRALGGVAAAGAGASTVAGLARVFGVGGAALLHSGNLNANESEGLKYRRGMDATIDTGRQPTEAERRAMSGEPTGGSPQHPVEQEVIGTLQAMGWSRAQAVGLAANFRAESNFRPDAVGDGGRAYGIGQWHPDRQAAFRQQFGKDIRGSSLQEQLAFADFELRRGAERAAGAKLMRETTAAGAADVVSRYYERPADRMGEAAKRAALADRMYRLSPQGLPSPDAVRASAAGGGRGFINPDGATSTEIRIGEINVVTQATDAQGIAGSIGPAIRANPLVQQSTTGLR